MSVESVSSYSHSSEEELAPVTKKRRGPPLWQKDLSTDWLEKVKQSRKYSLTLNGLGFCKSWTLPDSIRDLIQNATDSMYTRLCTIL
jgi:hypothetical protein